MKRIARLLIGGGVLAAVFSRVSFGEVTATVAGARALPIVGALALTLVVQWATSLRLKRLTAAHGLTLGTAQVLEINLATRFYGLFLPGGNFTSVAIRFLKLAQAQQHFAGAALSLLIDRVLATLALCAVGVGFWLIERPDAPLAVVLMMAGVLMVMVMLTAVLLERPPGPIVQHVHRLLGRLVPGKLATLRAVVRDSRALPPGTLPMACALSVGAHLIAVVTYYVLALAVGVQPSIVSMGWIRSAMILVTMVPVSIAGLGLREGAALALLATYDVRSDQAVAFSLLVFAVTVLAMGALGGLLEARRFVLGLRAAEGITHERV